MTAKKSVASGKRNTEAKVVGALRNAKTGRFTTRESVRSIERNSKKYADVLERLAKR
jgi:hypothetical protein